jgi:recombination protein RecA
VSKLEEALEKLRDQIGEAVVECLPSKTVHGVPTGSLSLDIALGTGGWPAGYGTELYGKKGGGKTTLGASSCVHTVGTGHKAIFFDTEHKAIPELFYGCGLPADRLVWLRTDTLSSAESVIDRLCDIDEPMVVLARLYSGTLALDVLKHSLIKRFARLAVVDSVAGISSSIELEKKAQDTTIALTARIMSAFLRPLCAPLGLSGCAVVWINQVREQIASTPYPLPRTTPGGHAIKFYSAMRVEINRVSRGKDYQTSKAVVKESCLSVPLGSAEIDIRYGRGVDYVSDVFAAAARLGVISTAGGYCKFGDLSLGDGRGKDNAIKWLRDNTNIVDQISEVVLDGN